MSVFNQPVIEVSWDNGRTWTEEAHSNCCGPGIVMRVVAPNGKILWQGRGISVTKTCTACNGTGKREAYEFEEILTPGEE
jgi:hypothetical protein